MAGNNPNHFTVASRGKQSRRRNSRDQLMTSVKRACCEILAQLHR